MDKERIEAKAAEIRKAREDRLMYGDPLKKRTRLVGLSKLVLHNIHSPHQT